MSDVVLECRDMSIRYMVGDFKAIGLKEWVVRRLTGNYHVKEFWADRHVSFVLNRGDMLGIIGTNGAGKSTILKAISGIMEPTEGQVIRKGKISALLELASGFDGDLTVKENAYLRGSMLGYTRAFMNETYERIIDFAELKEFENRPFKQLSSGMKSRLAFSIASLVQPDILILDEVLSVGDGAFRVKSEAKMKEIIKGGATTILVSHSITQVRAMCNKILWLHKGEQIAFTDDVKGVCDCYEAFLKGEGDKALILHRRWSAGIGEPQSFEPPREEFPYRLMVKGPETLVCHVNAYAKTDGAPLPRAGVMRIRFLDVSGRHVEAPDLWISTAYGGEFVYVHLDTAGCADFKVRVQVPVGAVLMEVDFSPFKCKTTIRLTGFSIVCGDDPAAQESRIHDPNELS